ncbi:MAG: hypothetical protein L3J83_01385 [Proteobacteria bacterium]|nr:hypothetical protein [Pseudomonadota bacterium]
MKDSHTPTSQEISKSIDNIELGDMSDEDSYLIGLKRQLNNHWSKVKGKLNEDVNFKVEYTGVGAEPYIKLGSKIKEIALTDLGDMSGEKSYLAGLKKHIKKQVSTVKEKLNQDVTLKVKYTGVGTEPFVAMGKKIKRQLQNKHGVMVLGQGSNCQPIVIDKSTDVKSIPLKGKKYDHQFDSYTYGAKKQQINVLGSSHGHSIENIIKTNLVGIESFVIYLSLASNDPLDEFSKYMTMIEKHKMDGEYILIAFLHEDRSQHDPIVMIDAITSDYPDIGIIHINTATDEMDVVLDLVVSHLYKK